MSIISFILFCATLFLCVVTYALYPIAIYFISRFYSFKVDKKDYYPFVSIIISAYNEEKHIEEKITNTLSLDYPKDKLEIIIGSDGSSDKTVELAEKYSAHGIKLIDFKVNRGKTIVQNECVTASKGEILIFMDAASLLNKDAIRKIVQNFADSRIGCVAGCLRFVNTETNLTTESQGIYWKYELKIRELESHLGCLIGVDGPLYAIKRENYVQLRGNIISDLLSPLLVLAAGKMVVLEKEALVNEYPTQKSGEELNTRRRITLRALVGLTAHAELLNPFKYPTLALQIFFHKLLRWFVGPLVIVNILSCWFLSDNTFFAIILVGYMLFFAVAILGLIIGRFGIRWRAVTIPYYFTLVNLAATLGIIDFIRRKQAVSWTPVRK